MQVRCMPADCARIDASTAAPSVGALRPAPYDLASARFTHRTCPSASKRCPLHACPGRPATVMAADIVCRAGPYWLSFACSSLLHIKFRRVAHILNGASLGLASPQAREAGIWVRRNGPLYLRARAQNDSIPLMLHLAPAVLPVTMVDGGFPASYMRLVDESLGPPHWSGKIQDAVAVSGMCATTGACVLSLMPTTAALFLLRTLSARLIF